jgi:predicted transport protein
LRIFDIRGTTLDEIQREQFLLEKEIQRITEANLKLLFGLELVKSEFELKGLRIDTLAFDPESKGFIIMEYKRDRNFSVVDQGMAYLNLMLNNKADFILEYNERKSPGLKRDDVDWTQTRVIFVAPEFTKYQQHAIGFKDLGIQLWEVHKYKNNLVVFNEIKPFEATESISTIAKTSKNPEVQRISEEIRVYTEEDLLKTCNNEIKDLYHELKNQILSLGNDIEVRPTKKYVGFRRTQQFLGIVFLKERLKLYLNVDPSQLKYLSDKVRDVSNVGHYSHGDSEIVVSNPGDLSPALALTKQVYDKS